ncbi:MAG: UbiX family flavin prenyltransferase [Thermodesulfobacteriota bacterium]
MMRKKIILGITGATGSLYALEFLKLMATTDAEVHAIISEAGEQVLRLELGIGKAALSPYVAQWHDIKNFAAAVSSGSGRFDGMTVLPCTMGTLAAIANGLTRNLIHRAADVTLKERRPLILAVRETPLNRIHLANMLKADEAGAVICPPMPAFYHKPESLEAMARAFSGRVASLLGFDLPDLPRWEGKGREKRPRKTRNK